MPRSTFYYKLMKRMGRTCASEGKFFSIFIIVIILFDNLFYSLNWNIKEVCYFFV